MPPYRVLIAKEVIASLANFSRREKQRVTQFFETLADDPYRAGDYVEQDETGRPIQVLVVGKIALWFWSDHAVKEVKVLDLKSAGR
jgi:mRNA-degrading endonuclease RelE of RelBE toxin-antitoxin system